ncbi:MAG: type II toxin-antitoxin system RelE/ParE family toxin [Gaiellaceae bacterium]
MDARDRPLIWLHGEVKTPPFSSDGRLEAGLLLRRLQRGDKLAMPVSRPMPQIAAGCHELRINDGRAAWRIVYFVGANSVVVLDVFAKNSRRTPSQVIANCKRRLEAYKLTSGE